MSGNIKKTSIFKSAKIWIMFLFYVLSFFKKGDSIQGGTLFKGGHYLRKYGIPFTAGEDMVICILDSFSVIFIDRLWLGVEVFVDPVIGGKTEKNKRQKFEIILSRYTQEYTVYFCFISALT